MYWLRKCIFSIQPIYEIGICKTCKKVISFNKLKSADPRDALYNWKGPQELIKDTCLKKNKNFITFNEYLDIEKNKI